MSPSLFRIIYPFIAILEWTLLVAGLDVLKPGKELVISWIDQQRKFLELSPRGVLLMGQLRRIMGPRRAA
jgi:hypothetical protein